MKQRAKPWDRRKHPYVRAMMETLKSHQLNMSSTEGNALGINWDCRNIEQKFIGSLPEVC